MEFVTDQHTEDAVAANLAVLRKKLLQSKKPGAKYQLPRHVVIDMCWPLLKATLRELALCPTNIFDYLGKMSSVMEGHQKLAETDLIVSICGSHVNHAWARHGSWKENKIDRDSRDVILRACNYLTICETMEDVDGAFKEFCRLCLKKFTSAEVRKSRKKFEDMELGAFKDEPEDSEEDEAGESSMEDPEQADRKKLLKELDVEEKELKSHMRDLLAHIKADEELQKSRRTIKRSSPMFQRFQAIYEEVCATECSMDEDVPEEEEDEEDPEATLNRCHNPAFLTYFLENWAPLFPLISAMVAGKENIKYDDGDSVVCIPTNAVVERYFKYKKHSELPVPCIPISINRYLEGSRVAMMDRCQATLNKLDRLAADEADDNSDLSDLDHACCEPEKRRCVYDELDDIPRTPCYQRSRRNTSTKKRRKGYRAMYRTRKDPKHPKDDEVEGVDDEVQFKKRMGPSPKAPKSKKKLPPRRKRSKPVSMTSRRLQRGASQRDATLLGKSSQKPRRGMYIYLRTQEKI